MVEAILYKLKMGCEWRQLPAKQFFDEEKLTWQGNAVRIESLYLLEKKLFGISDGLTILTPNEYWLVHRITLLDTGTGLFYLTWIPIPLLFGTYLFFKDQRAFYPFHQYVLDVTGGYSVPW